MKLTASREDILNPLQPECLDVDDIHLDRPHAANNSAPVLPPGVTLEQWEQEIIREALRRAGGNKSQAARLLGLTRNALRYRLSQMGLEA